MADHQIALSPFHEPETGAFLNQLMHADDLDAADRWILLILFLHGAREHTQIPVSHKRLGNRCGMSRSTLINRLGSLEKRQYIHVNRRYEAHSRTISAFGLTPKACGSDRPWLTIVGKPAPIQSSLLDFTSSQEPTTNDIQTTTEFRKPEQPPQTTSVNPMSVSIQKPDKVVQKPDHLVQLSDTSSKRTSTVTGPSSTPVTTNVQMLSAQGPLTNTGLSAIDNILSDFATNLFKNETPLSQNRTTACMNAINNATELKACNAVVQDNLQKRVETIAKWLAKHPYGDCTATDVEKELLATVTKHTPAESEPTAVLDALMELPVVGQAKSPLAYLRYIVKQPDAVARGVEKVHETAVQRRRQADRQCDSDPTNTNTPAPLRPTNADLTKLTAPTAPTPKKPNSPALVACPVPHEPVCSDVTHACNTKHWNAALENLNKPQDIALREMLMGCHVREISNGLEILCENAFQQTLLNLSLKQSPQGLEKIYGTIIVSNIKKREMTQVT